MRVHSPHSLLLSFLKASSMNSKYAKKVRRHRLGLLISCASVLVAPALVRAEPIDIDPAMPMPKMISGFNLFKDSANQVPNEGVVPYDLSTPLFTDYAVKDRFIWMPKGASAAYSETEVFDFPVGTVIAKTFSYPADLREPTKDVRRIETRILWRKEKGWLALPYLWNADATDAKLAVAGAQMPIDWVSEQGQKQSTNYLVPNMNQCKLCHENQQKIAPIGPKARYLNKDYPYAGGTANQLETLAAAGYLTGLPESGQRPPAISWNHPDTGTLTERARTYLDINCAHCHNPKGPAYTSGLDLTYHQEAPHRIGVYKPPVAAGRGSAGLKFSIVPQHPEESILLARMHSLDPGMMMPQLGRTMNHPEGIALIEEWIKSLNPEDYRDLMEKGDGGEVPAP